MIPRPIPPLPRPAELVGLDHLPPRLGARRDGFPAAVPESIELALRPRGRDADGDPHPVVYFALPIADARELLRDLAIVLADRDAEVAPDPPTPAHPGTHR